MNLSSVNLYTKNIVVDGDEFPVYYDRTRPNDDRFWQPMEDVLLVLLGRPSEGVEGFTQWLAKKGYPQLIDMWNNYTLIPIYDWHTTARKKVDGGTEVTMQPSTMSTWHGTIFINPNYMMNELLDGGDFMDPDSGALKNSFKEHGLKWHDEAHKGNPPTGYLCVYYVLLHELFHNVHGDIFDWEQLTDENGAPKDEVYNDHEYANKAMDYSCNYDVEFFFPELHGFGEALGMFADDERGQNAWMPNYDLLVKEDKEKEEEAKKEQEQNKEDEKSQDYKDGYEDMCSAIASYIDSVDGLIDESDVLDKLVEEFSDKFGELGIDINDIINQALNESEFVWKDGDYNEGAVDAFKDWVKYIKKRKEEKESQQNGDQQNQDGNQDGQQQDGGQQGGQQQNGGGQPGQGGQSGNGGQSGQSGQSGSSGKYGSNDQSQQSDNGSEGDGDDDGENGNGGENGDKPGENGQGDDAGQNGNDGNDQGDKNGGKDGDKNGSGGTPNSGDPGNDYTEYNQYYKQGWDEIMAENV